VVPGGGNFRTNRGSNKAKATTQSQRLETTQETERGRGSSSGGTILFCQPSPARQPPQHQAQQLASLLPRRQQLSPQRSLTSCLPRYVACVATVLPHLDARPYGTLPLSPWGDTVGPNTLALEVCGPLPDLSLRPKPQFGPSPWFR